MALGVAALGEARDILAVILDEVPDVCPTLAGARTDVLDSAAKPNIVADEVLATGLGAQVVYICLLHLEMSRGVTAVVGLLAIGHGLLRDSD